MKNCSISNIANTVTTSSKNSSAATQGGETSMQTFCPGLTVQHTSTFSSVGFHSPGWGTALKDAPWPGFSL